MLLVQDIRPLPRSPQQRLVSIAIVASIHVVVIAGILMSLNKTLLPPPHTEIIVDTVPPPKIKDTLPPPNVVLVDPTKVDVPPPVVNVVRDSDAHPITNVAPTPNTGPVNPPVRIIAAQPIIGTHTTPDYPPLDARLGHEGTVELKLTINEWGAVVAAQVERSSGYESLDRAAAEWVKAHWLYHPATRAGDGVPSTADVAVSFRLTDRR
jgi:periplasmic protein TonB